MKRTMEKDLKDIPLSESNVSIKLADIQKRCAQLMEDDGLELTLEEASKPLDNANPYDRS